MQVIDSMLEGFMEEFRAPGLADRAILVVLGVTASRSRSTAISSANRFTPVTQVPLMIRFPERRNPQTSPRWPRSST